MTRKLMMIAVTVAMTFGAWADYTVTQPTTDLGKIFLPATIKGKLRNTLDSRTILFEPMFDTYSTSVKIYPYTGADTSYQVSIKENGSYFSGLQFKAGYKYSVSVTSFWCPTESEFVLEIGGSSLNKNIWVKFDGNGGKVSSSSRYYTVGDNYLFLPDAEWAGHTFSGWYSQRIGGERLTSTSTVCLGYDTLYAHWVDESAPVLYKIIMFYPNGGNGNPYSQILIYGYTLPLQANKFVRDGYKFVGWSGTPDGEVLFENEESVYLKEFSIDEIGAQIPLYAKWEKLPNPAVAATETVNGIAWSYRVSNGKAEIYNLDSAAIPPSTTGAISIPSTLGGYPVTRIGGYAFCFCFGLTSVSIPSGVTSIGDWAFAGCIGLTSMTIPNGVTSIGDGAFVACSGLTIMMIGNGVMHVGYQAFGACDRLESFVVTSGNMTYKVVSGLLLSRDGKTLVAVPGICESVAIPDSVTSIREFAFAGSKGLKSVTIPNSVTNIGWGAFHDCSGLTNVTVPGSVTNIGNEAFYGCSGLKNVIVEPGDAERVRGLIAASGFDVSGVSFIEVAWVVFAVNGGSVDESIRDVTSGCAVGELPAPTRTGYTFEGWWTAASGGTQITESTTVMENVTYYAHWTANNYTVVFDPNGGEGKMDDQPMVYDVEVPFSECRFALQGFLFRGWAEWADGGVVYRDGATVKNLSVVANDVVTLYAVWQKKPDWVVACEEMFGGTGNVSIDEDGNIVMMLTNDVSGTVEIPDNVGAVTIDLNGHDMIGDDGPAIRIVAGDGEGDGGTQGGGETTRLAIVDMSEGEKGHVAGGGESAGIEIAEDAAKGVRLDVEDGVGVFNGDGTEQDWRELSPVEYTLQVGEYFKATLAELGYDVPTDGTAYSVVAKGLPAGLTLKYNAAVKDKKGKIIKKAKSEWWIEGVPTAAVDFFTNPPYLVITVNGTTTTEPLPVEVAAQEVIDLGELELGQTVNTNGWLAGVGAGWTVSGLPTGLKYTAKAVYKDEKKKVVKYPAYTVYGKTTKAGLFTITAKKKAGAFYETMKYRVIVRPKAVDVAIFGEELTNITTMAYVPVEWDLAGGGGALGDRALPGGDGNESGALGDRALPIVSNVAKVAGLPTGLKFTAKAVYSTVVDSSRVQTKVLKYPAYTIYGTPTKTGTFVVTFTKNVKSGKKTVAKTAQILWTVVANDTPPELTFNTAPVTAKYAYKAKEKVNGKTKTVTKYLTRAFTFGVREAGGGAVGGSFFLTPDWAKEEAELIWAEGMQDLWGSTYKTVGAKVFYTSSKAKYKVFQYTVDVGGQSCALSVKVTTAGKATATLTYDTGKTSKGKPVYYKPTCSTVVNQMSAPDPATFSGVVYMYFAPSAGNNFPGWAGSADVP